MTKTRVATLSDLADNAMTMVEVGDTKVLLVRRGDTVHAVQGLCPHKGVPLDKGILDGDRIVCGIHRAAFLIDSGEVVEPPAQDCLARYDVTVEDGVVHVDVPEDAPIHPEPSMASRTAGTPDTRHFVIIGAGAAGWSAAETLRREGFAGKLTILSDEEQLPFDRTDLSKSYLGADQPEEPWRRDTAFLEKHDLNLRHARVEAVNYDARRVVLHGGEAVPYDALLIATGSSARELDVAGADKDGIHTIRDLTDAQDLRADLREQLNGETDVPVVVIGGGFIGMEAAASLSKHDNVSVTVVMPSDVPFPNILGERMGQRIRAEHEEKGVTFVTGEKRGAVSGFKGNGRVEAVQTEEGDPIPAALVIVGIGAVPRTDWLDVPTEDDGGITVGGDLSLPNKDDVWIAGDIARLPTPWGTARIEHWRHAEQLGALAARNMLGRNETYSEAPFFWTMQQIAGSYSYTGHTKDWDDIRIEGDPDGSDFIVRYIKDGKVMATFGHGMLADQARIEREMAKRGPLDT